MRKHTNLLQRELKSRSIDQINWLELVERMDYLFRVLVNADQAAGQLADELRRRGQSVDAFVEEKRRREKALTMGKQRLKTQDFQLGVQELMPHLPPAGIRFVLLSDLQCLDLWLRLAAHLDPKPAEFALRNNQLRELASRYIGQFAVTVGLPDAQHLALELLDAIRIPRDQSAVAAD